MNLRGGSQYKEIVQFSSKQIVLQSVEDTSSRRIANDNNNKNNNKNKNNQSPQTPQAPNQNRIGVGNFSIQNISSHNSIIYKIRGNRPKNYRLSNPCSIVEVNQVAQIDVRLVSTLLYTSKDLFEVKYLEFTPNLVQLYQKIKCESISQFWQHIELNSDKFQIRLAQLSLEFMDQADQNVSSLKQKNQLTGSQSPNLFLQVSNSPGMRSASPTPSNIQSPFTLRNKSSIFMSTRANSNTTPKTSVDQQMFQSQIQNRNMLTNNSHYNNYIINGSNNNNSNNNYNSSNNMNNFNNSSNTFSGNNTDNINNGIINSNNNNAGHESDFKQLYEKLVIKVDEQDKQLFVLNQERKKLQQEWNLLSKKQEQIKNSEYQEQKIKNLNGIQPTSAVIIAVIAILIGIYLGN